MSVGTGHFFNAYYITRHGLLPAPTRLLPSSLLTHLLPTVLSLASMRNKTECSFQLLWPLLPPSLCHFLFILSTNISLLILPRLTLYALWSLDSTRCAPTLFLDLPFMLSGLWIPPGVLQPFPASTYDIISYWQSTTARLPNSN